MKKSGTIKYRELKCGVLVSGDAGDISVVKVDDGFAVDSTLLLEVVPGCCALLCSVC